MKRSYIILTAVIIIIATATLIYNYRKAQLPENKPVSSTAEPAIRVQVAEFGTKLKNVSLLMPQSDIQSVIRLEYGKYLTPELISKWQANPSLALGRNVSSPWPDRINIVEVIRQADGSYKVEGNVIEISSVNPPGSPAATYPVTLRMEQRGDAWLIAGASKGAYVELSN